MRILTAITMLLSLCLSGTVLAQNSYFDSRAPKFEPIDPIYMVTDKNVAISLPKLVKIPNVKHREFQVHEYVYDNDFKLIDSARSYNVRRDYPGLFQREKKKA